MAKHVLDLMLWHPKKDITLCEITYIHRGAQRNLKTISGAQINKLEKGFMILDEEQIIPYHRIVKIKCKNNLIWKKCSNK